MAINGPSIVVEFSENCSSTAESWLLKRLKDTKQTGGAQLDVESLSKTNDSDGRKYLIIRASNAHTLLGAEVVGLQKLYKDGDMREFCFSDRQNFENSQDDEFLSDSEKLQIIKSELDNLRATNEEHVPGHETAKLYPGKSIFRRMETHNLISNMFCLHNRTKLDKLRMSWYKHRKATLQQPLDAVFRYFGGTIALYFSFLGFYTKMLIPLSLLSLLYYLLASHQALLDYATFAVFNILWAEIFLKLWRRQSTTHAYNWGTYGRLQDLEDTRAAYHGKMGVNPVTNHHEPVYPAWKHNLRIWLVSVPIVALCNAMAIFIMFYYFGWEIHLFEVYKDSNSLQASVMVNLPSVIYCVVILIANFAYRQLAEYLTDMENHRLQSSYMNHLILKIVFFNFVNNFLCLFYIAFVYNNMIMLRTTLRNLFLVQIIISQSVETLLPYFQYRHRSAKLANHSEKAEVSVEEQILLDKKRDIYEGTFDDYLELWLQFGYVVLFSCVFPAAAIFALVNNVVEIRSDAFKMCNNLRRPFANPSKNIGEWQRAFSMLSYLAVLTNCALIFQSPSFLKMFYATFSKSKSVNVTACFIVAEHFLLLLRYLVDISVSDVPNNVKIATERVLYRSVQALKKQAKLRAEKGRFKQTSLQMVRNHRTVTTTTDP